MPRNHGLHCKLPPRDQRGPQITLEEQMKFRCGIHSIFRALKTGPFLRGKPEEGWKAAQLEYHFGEVCQRFVFSLQQLNRLLPELLHAHTCDGALPFDRRLQFEAECQADQVFTYLNMLVDDVALMILLATGYPKSEKIDSMGKLRARLLAATSMKKNPPPVPSALTPVIPLLLELRRADSWWELAFVNQTGARQLIVHNHHLVRFQVQKHDGQGHLWSLLQSPFSDRKTGRTIKCADFLGLILATLTSLFDWLDRLEIALMAHLRTLDSSWSPPTSCHFFLLPVGNSVGTTTFDGTYFPVPLCEGSDPLPWEINILGAKHFEMREQAVGQ